MLQQLKHQQRRNYKEKNEGFWFAPGRYRLREQLRKRTASFVEGKEIPQKEEKVIDRGPTYVCPLSKQNFKGSCAIMQCNFNITKYQPGESSCLIIQSGGKEHFDKWDLQRSLSIAESKLYKLKDQGSKRASCVLMLNKILEFVRELPSQETRIEKISQISNFIGNSNLSLKELNAKASDVIRIKNNLSKVEDFIAQSGQNFTLAEILGTDKPIP